MTRAEIVAKFREENPEITTTVVTTAQANSWCVIGNLETAIRARLIRGLGTWTWAASTERYDLTTQISNFYDIDEYPGDGVYFNDKQLTKVSIAELRAKRANWKTDADGTPLYWYRQNQFLHIHPQNTSADTIEVYDVLIPEDFDDDAKTPFNQLTHLKPFHYSIVLYLRMRAKAKVGKPEESAIARAEYEAYIDWIKKEIGGNKYSQINFRGPVMSRRK